MLLAALIDAGASCAAVEAAVRACGVEAALSTEEVHRAGLRGALLRIELGASEHGRERRVADCVDAIARSGLPSRLRERATGALVRIGSAEAALHGGGVKSAHLHELGAADTLVDIVGVCAALEELAAGPVTCGPLPAGAGTVDTAHGLLPLPAPSTLAILSAAGAPLIPGPPGAELVTPTAAAILVTVARFEQPAMTLRRVGHGAGTRDDPRRPNLVRAWVGDPPAGTGGTIAAAFDDPTVELRTNLDDATPAAVAELVAACLEAGALDAWIVPATMKKGRPGHIVHVIAQAGAETALAGLLLERSPTLGVRATRAPRLVAGRDVVRVDIDGLTVRVKRKHVEGRLVDVRPEREDVARIAAASGRDGDRVLEELTVAARRILMSPDPGDP